MATRYIPLGSIDPVAVKAQVVQALGSEQFNEFMQAEWSMLYGEGDLMDTEVVALPASLHPKEEPGSQYTLIKFENVGWHRDDHDDLYYVLHVLEGGADLLIGKRDTQTVSLKPGESYLFNSNLYHKTALTGQQVLALVGGVEAADAKAMFRAYDQQSIKEAA